MPNSITHANAGIVIGSFTGAFLNVLLQVNKMKDNPDYKFQLGELVVMTAIGGFSGYMVGCLPDILEPAYHPNHRQLFHSFAILCLSLYGAYKIQSSDWDIILKNICTACLLSYALHLIDDSGTPKKIPII